VVSKIIAAYVESLEFARDDDAFVGSRSTRSSRRTTGRRSRPTTKSPFYC
jgi:hypothetical protein